MACHACCTHVNIWKALVALEAPMPLGATYSLTNWSYMLAFGSTKCYSCCHWSNMQLNLNFWKALSAVHMHVIIWKALAALEALCAKSIKKQSGKMFQWKHYVLNACTCLCTWINAWLCNMENMFLLHTESSGNKLFLLECCAARWCCQDNHKENTKKTQRNHQRLNELSWLRS